MIVSLVSTLDFKLLELEPTDNLMLQMPLINVVPHTTLRYESRVLPLGVMFSTTVIHFFRIYIHSDNTHISYILYPIYNYINLEYGKENKIKLLFIC